MAKCSVIPKIKNKEGKWVESKLFKDLLNKFGNRDQAIAYYKEAYSSRFKDKVGDWETSDIEKFNQPINTTVDKKIDENGEPTIELLSNALNIDTESYTDYKEEIPEAASFDIIVEDKGIQKFIDHMNSRVRRLKRELSEKENEPIEKQVELNIEIENAEKAIEDIVDSQDIEHVAKISSDLLTVLENKLGSEEITAGEINEIRKMNDTMLHLHHILYDKKVDDLPESIEAVRARAVQRRRPVRLSEGAEGQSVPDRHLGGLRVRGGARVRLHRDYHVEAAGVLLGEVFGNGRRHVESLGVVNKLHDTGEAVHQAGSRRETGRGHACRGARNDEEANGGAEISADRSLVWQHRGRVRGSRTTS